MIWVFFEDVNDGSVIELCFLEEIGEGIYELLAIYIYKKKKKGPNPRLENRPDYRLDFLGRVGLKAAKPDFYQARFRIIVNPTQPNISPSHQFAKICLDSCNSEMAVCCVPCQSKPKNLVDLCF